MKFMFTMAFDRVKGAFVGYGKTKIFCTYNYMWHAEHKSCNVRKLHLDTCIHCNSQLPEKRSSPSFVFYLIYFHNIHCNMYCLLLSRLLTKRNNNNVHEIII